MKQKNSLTRRDFLRYSALSGSAALLVACAPAAPAADTGEAAPAAAAEEAPAAEMSGPKQGGTMTWVGHQEVAGLSPAFMGPTVHWVMIINIQNPLVTVDEFNEQELVLAKSIDVAADGLTY
ncbi:MAG: twin-arginine translocation signal domain-containing protein, partial [Caldilineaceae bacterium]|nr:twin-arginine translocation signal domain-containing protein [Caldilineaceae bacterium]